MKIGLEVHVALPTHSKLFCSCSTEDADQPNTNICPICMGFPGSKPSLNKEAVRIAKSVSKALNCKINQSISFVRKTYFYPDLPKSFQITQLAGSIGIEGEIKLSSSTVRIRRIQIEEDPARIIRESKYTLLDFNRSGIPLIEIVTDPDITSEDQLREFLSVLRSILYYIGVDIDKEMKADLNISLGENRVEIKNVTGIKNLIDASRYETKRQSEIIKSGRQPEKETRSYEEASQTTVSSREKETDEEYGYIYEPDLTDFSVSGLEIKEDVFDARQISREIADKYSLDYKTILELIALDKDALNLLKHGLEKTNLKPDLVLNALEAKKRFGNAVNEKSLVLLAGYIEKGIQIDREIIKKVENGIPPAEDVISDEKIDDSIEKELSSSPDLVERYKKNPKVVDFIVSTISKKYGIPQKKVAVRIKDILAKYIK